MGTKEDWRYSNIYHLEGLTFTLAKYNAPSEEWDHDHCNGCWAKFADFDGADILHEGYVTAIPYEETPEPEFITQCKEQGMHCVAQPNIGGFELHWVCPRCFEDFRELWGFKLEP